MTNTRGVKLHTPAKRERLSPGVVIGMRSSALWGVPLNDDDDDDESEIQKW